jgi:uncharacterized protein (DUF433 family)
MAVLPIEHIVRDSNGTTRIAGTRIRVQDVATYHLRGISVDEIADDFAVTPSQVFAALSYYYDHREEIEADVQRQIEVADEFLAEGHARTTEQLRQRIEAQKGDELQD